MVGWRIIPAPAVVLVASSIRMKLPVSLLRRYSSTMNGAVVRSEMRPISFRGHEPLLELLGEAGVRSWQLQLTCPHGNAVDNAEIMLQPYMLLEFYEQLERI